MNTRVLLLTVLASLQGAGCQRESEQVERVPAGEEVVQLVESYFVDDEGRPLVGENAWSVLMGSLDRLERLTPEDEASRSAFWGSDAIERVAAGEAKPGGEDWLVAADRVARAAEAGVFEGFRELVRERRVVRARQEGELFRWLAYELVQMRRAVRLNAARLRIAAHEGRMDEAAEAFVQMLAMGRIASHQFMLIDGVAGSGMMSRALDTVAGVVRDGEISVTDAGLFMAAMDHQLPLAPLELGIRGDLVMALDVNRWIYEDDAAVRDRLAQYAGSTMAGGTLGNEPLASERRSEAFLKERAARYVSAAQKPLCESLPELQGLRREMSVEAPEDQLVARLTAQSMESLFVSRAEAEALASGVRAMLALEQFYAKTGRYPGALGASAGLSR